MVFHALASKIRSSNMVQLTFHVTSLAVVSTLFSLAAGQLSPGSYFIVNVGTGLRVLTGSSKGTVLAQEGFPVTAFPVCFRFK